MAAVVRPFLIELSEATGESAGFVVRSGRNVYWVDSVDDEESAVQVQDRTGFLRTHALDPGGSGAARPLTARGDSALSRSAARAGQPAHDHRRQRRCVRTSIRSSTTVSCGRSTISVTASRRSTSRSAAQVAIFEGALFVNAPSFRFPAEGDKDRVEALVVDAAQRLSRPLHRALSVAHCLPDGFHPTGA